ncbi:hypothetical protein [Actinoplanes friuliensis]|uniref:hypothetical protein n=1 Tax=Actinoplanes friuliensis TaxID=196914 RepID=UPI0011DDFD0C|nr:hypothetical protein [Actinoplanes friuliensis]
MEIGGAGVLRLVEDFERDGSAGDELVALAEDRPELVAPHLLRLVETNMWLPAFVFRAMTEDTAGEVVRRIDEGLLPPGLYRLAAGRTAAAVDAFGRWARESPEWLRHFPDGLGKEGHVGGWELDPAGNRRDLTSRSATALVPVGEGGAPVSGGALDGKCGWCGLPMWRLLEVDRVLLADLFPDSPGPLVISTCARCGGYADIFTEQGRFVEENGEPGFLGEDEDGWELPDEGLLALGEARPDPWATGAGRGWSTLGGLPLWGQEPAYPACPRCSRTMPYVGQVTGRDLDGQWGQGCHYLFHDPGCGLSAVVYQQT